MSRRSSSRNSRNYRGRRGGRRSSGKKLITAAVVAVACLGAVLGADTGDLVQFLDYAGTDTEVIAEGTESAYTPSTFSEEEWPEMYRIRGAAVLDGVELEPGQVEYIYNPYSKTQRVEALLTHENLEYGKRERESLSDLEPIGWPENREVEVSYRNGATYHGMFWNRSHLLAHALGGEDEEKNLITGTRAQNVGTDRHHGGMQFTEEIAREYLTEHPDGQLYYVVTPIYEEDENIPRSVFVDMRSDDGHIDMHVEVFNEMPGYEIDYANGTWDN